MFTIVPMLLGAAPAALAQNDLGRTSRSESYTPPPAKPGYSYPECYCTDSVGERVEVGQTACLKIGSREITSRCERARNLVIWRHQSEGCPGV
jgi:hypothetical protein